MIVLDAYALVALLAAEPAGSEVRALLENEQCAVSVLNLSEAADVLQRTHDIDVAATRGVVSTFTGSSLAVVEMDERCGWRAAELRARYYRRRGSEISLADCVLLATATPGRDAVATSDPPVTRIAGAEGIAVVPLPDRRGHRPA
jgi:predicted nucleic acid-binding protein